MRDVIRPIFSPVLWLIGSEDRQAMESQRLYKAELAATNVQACILAGLDHERLFDEINTEIPVALAFTDTRGPSPSSELRDNP